MRFVLITLTTVLFAVSAKSQSELAFGDGERLEFAVSYRAKMWPNTDVGDLVLSVSKQHDLFTIVGHGQSRPFFRWFFDLNDTYTTLMDASTLKPLSASERTRHGKYQFDGNKEFDWSEMVVRSTWRTLRHPENRHKTISITEQSVDALSLFYRLRNTDTATLKIGVPVPLEMVLKDTIRIVNYTFLGRDVLNVSGLGRFRAFKFSCTLATSSSESFEDGSEFFIWISDDLNRIPLLVESPIRVGSVRARLRRFDGLRHPMDSRIR